MGTERFDRSCPSCATPPALHCPKCGDCPDFYYGTDEWGNYLGCWEHGPLSASLVGVPLGGEGGAR